jgi:hypothetical protein
MAGYVTTASTNGSYNEEPADTGLAWHSICLVVLLCILIAATVVGNTLIIVAVMTTRRLRTVTNCFVMSLAVADWLVGIFVMPPAVAVQFMGKINSLCTFSDRQLDVCYIEVWGATDVLFVLWCTGVCCHSYLILTSATTDKLFIIR